MGGCCASPKRTFLSDTLKRNFWSSVCDFCLFFLFVFGVGEREIFFFFRINAQATHLLIIEEKSVVVALKIFFRPFYMIAIAIGRSHPWTIAIKTGGLKTPDGNISIRDKPGTVQIETELKQRHIPLFSTCAHRGLVRPGPSSPWPRKK